jgi:hypothetical protein
LPTASLDIGDAVGIALGSEWIGGGDPLRRGLQQQTIDGNPREDIKKTSVFILVRFDPAQRTGCK